MRADYDRRYASNDTRYIYAVGSDTPLRIEDADYDREHMERVLGSAFWSASPNTTVRALSREFVRPQPDEWWGEDMYSMPLSSPRVTVTIRLARVYCPGGVYFDVRDDLADRMWCPARSARPGERPVAMQPDSVFSSNGRRLPRRVDPTVRTPIFRVPTPTEVGQQQGEPAPPRDPVGRYPRPLPQNPQTPGANQPPQTQPPQNQPPQNQPPQNQPPQTQPQTPPQNQPGQTPAASDTTGGDRSHGDNGRRAHGDPRNADPRGNGNGYGNGGRQQPTSQPPANTPPSNPSQSNPQQQGQTQGASSQTGNGHQDHGNSNPGSAANNGNSNDHGNDKGQNNAKPDHSESPKDRMSAILKSRVPQTATKQDDKKAASDSTEKKKP
jgi:hypothetical protein